MRMPRLRAVSLAAMLAAAAVSCGSRTGLFGEDADGVGTTTNGPHGTIEGGVDGGVDTGFDVIPQIDGMPRPDVDRTDCPDADATYVYVVTEQNELFSFYPPDLTFKFIGNLVCPVVGSATPFSMAVDRRGVAYVLYNDGNIYRVSTATAACTGTTFQPNQESFATFGMGFASDFGGPAERLYVSDNDFDGTLRGLGFIDTTSFNLSFIGSFGTNIRRSELTGTGDGRLFAFWPDGLGGGGSHLTELNKTTGKVVAQTDLPIGDTNDAFAFAFWGGDFWIFLERDTDSATIVYQIDGATGAVKGMTNTGTREIVGAGVSTCAPTVIL